MFGLQTAERRALRPLFCSIRVLERMNRKDLVRRFFDSVCHNIRHNYHKVLRRCIFKLSFTKRVLSYGKCVLVQFEQAVS